jgi:hypothetical protein
MFGFLKNLFGKREEQLEFIDLDEDYATGPQVDTVPNATGRFGYDHSNPIPVRQQDGELGYLETLQCACGEPFAFHRVGSFGSGPDEHIVDGYELICRNRTHRIMLYMDMYHAGPSSLLPEGLSRGTQRSFGLPFHVENFPEGLPAAIEALQRRLR